MRAGQLDQRIKFRKRSISVVNGDKTVVNQDLTDEVWASVKFVGTPSAGASEERIDDEQITGKVKVEIVCRYIKNIKFTDYFVYQGADFDIYSWQIMGRNEYLKIRGEMRDDKSSLPDQ